MADNWDEFRSGRDLYHFTDFNGARAILQSGRLALGAFRNSGDPRENKPPKLMIDSPSDHSAVQGWKAMGALKASVRFLSCCADDHPSAEGRRALERLRMWDRYGGKHLGACLVLNRDVLRDQLTYLPGELHDGHVQYETARDTWASHLRLALINEIEGSAREHFHQYAQPSLLTKDIDWRDEVEYRYAIVGAERPLSVSLESLRAVILGVDAWRPLSIRDLCRRRNVTHFKAAWDGACERVRVETMP